MAVEHCPGDLSAMRSQINDIYRRRRLARRSGGGRVYGTFGKPRIRGVSYANSAQKINIDIYILLVTMI